MIELPDLYDHQQKMLSDVRSAISRYRRSILCAPPGTGKTRLAKRILGSYANRPATDGESGFGLFVVHRRGLVDNASISFSEYPALPHGIIMSGRETDFSNRIQVASIDTITSWYCESDGYSGHTFDLIIFDECHSAIPTFRTFMNSLDAKRTSNGMKSPYVLGLSATPQHKELNQVFNIIVKGPSPQWLIDNGFLSPFRYFQCTKGDLGKLVKKGDDYTESSISAAMQNLSGDLVRDWKRLADGRATVGFFPRRSHAQEAVGMLVSAGVRCQYVDSTTPDDERREMFKDLNEGRIDYIANVGIIERGTDIPRIGCVQLCTAIGNVVRYKQMIGRGSRTHSDVIDCIVLDHADNIRRLGFFEDDIDWSLEWGERPAKTAVTKSSMECPSCGSIYRGGKCRQCGYEPSKKEFKAQGLQFVGGELQEVTKKTREKSDKTPSCTSMLISALYQCGKTGKTFNTAVMIAKSMARKHNMEFVMPAWFEVAGSRYSPVPRGHIDGKRLVKNIYGFTVRDYTNVMNPYRQDGY